METLPEAFKALSPYKQFVIYRLEDNPKNPGKKIKRPLDYRTGAVANPLDPKNWADAETAIAAAKRFGKDHGVGFVLTKEDPFFCIDIDNCFDTTTNKWFDFSQQIIHQFAGAAVEVSSSGKGLHIIGSSTPLQHTCKNGTFNIELYTEDRFIALTGWHATGDAGRDFTAILSTFIDEHFKKTSIANTTTLNNANWWSTKPVEEWNGPTDDDELINLALKSISGKKAFGNGASFADLWNDNEEVLSVAYPPQKDDVYDRSSADMALAQHLGFWTGYNAKRMELLMRQSALAREKWDTHRTYLKRTIHTAYMNARENAASKNESILCVYKQSPDKPIALPEGLPDVMRFNHDLLPASLKNYVCDAAERTQCPIDFIAIALITSISAIVGRKYSIYPKQQDDWEVIPNQWGCIIGRPSTMKSPALKQALRPIKKLELIAQEAHKKELKLYKATKSVDEMNYKKVKEQAAKLDKEKAIQLMLSVDDDKEEPVSKRYIVNDATVEKLGELLNQNPNGLLLVRDELGGWLSLMQSEEGAITRAFYLECFDGNNSFTYDRIGRGTVKIESCCLSLIGGIQPSKIASLVRGALDGTIDDGLIQRLQLAVWPDDHDSWILIDRKPDTDAQKRVDAIIDTLDSLPNHAPNELRFDTDSQILFNTWYTNHMKKYLNDEIHPALQSHLMKMPQTIAGLALLFELIEGGRDQVKSQATTRAISWAEYLITHAKRLYASVTRGPYIGARLILQRRNKLPNTFTPRQVVQKGWMGLNTTEIVNEALTTLVDYNYLRLEEIKNLSGNGRPSQQYTWK